MERNATKQSAMEHSAMKQITMKQSATKQSAMEHRAMKDRPIHPLVQDTHAFKSDPAIQVRQARFRKRRGFDAAGHLCLPWIQRIEALQAVS